MRKLRVAVVSAWVLALFAPGGPPPARAAFITTNEAGMDAIYSQAGFGANPIDIVFLPAQQLSDATFLDITSVAELQALLALPAAPSPTVSMLFVDTIDVCGAVVDPGFVGCAELPGNRIVVESVFASGANGAALNAHELGHNLNLEHVANVANLMNPVILGGTTLDPAQVATALASPLVQVGAGGQRFIEILPIVATPEPGTLGPVALGLSVLARRRRRTA